MNDDRQRKRDAAKKSKDRHIYTSKSVRIKEAHLKSKLGRATSPPLVALPLIAPGL